MFKSGDEIFHSASDVEAKDLIATKAVLDEWRERGAQDSRRGRNALMRPTKNGGVFFDIDPPPYWEYDEEETRKIAKAYYEGFCSV